MIRSFRPFVKNLVDKLIVTPADRLVMPFVRRMFIWHLRRLNRRRLDSPNTGFETRTVLIYSPNIGGHRPVYAAKFIDYYRRQDCEVYFVYSGIEVDATRRVYSKFRSRYTDSFKDDEHVHMVCVRDRLSRDTDELAFIVNLQREYKPFLTIFVDGDVLMRTFRRQARRGEPRLLGRNYAIFIMIDFPYRDMSLRGVFLHPVKRQQVPHLLFHRYYFRYLNLLDGALVSDENLIRRCEPSRHIPLGDVVHYALPPDDDKQKNRFFEKTIRAYDDFLARHPDKQVLLQFGELEERKGFNFLLKLAAENPDLVVVRAGRTKPSYRIRWEALLHREKLLLEDRLFEVDIFIDSQPFIDRLFESTDFFVFAYRNHFRTSIMLPLALSYGKPVMVPDVGLLGWRVEEYGVGRVFQHLSYESFAEEFKAFRDNLNFYAENVSNYYESEFSDQTFGRRLDSITYTDRRDKPNSGVC